MARLKRCLGVDLGHHTVKVVEMALESEAVRVIRAASQETGVDPTTMNVDQRRDAIAGALKDLLKKNRINTKQAVFGITGQKVFVRRFRLPETSEERLNRILQFEARQQIPFPLDKTAIQWQYRFLPEEREVEVLLVAIRKDDIRDFMQLVNKTGLRPMRISVSSLAVFNAFRFLHMEPEKAVDKIQEIEGKKKKSKEAGGSSTKSKLAIPKLSFGKKKKGGEEAPSSPEEQPEEQPEEELEGMEGYAFEEVKGFVNFGATSFDLVIARLGEKASLGFIRTVPKGGQGMTMSLMENLGVESYQDAERIKVSQTKLTSELFDFEEEDTTNQEASLAVSQVTDELVSEIRRSLDFYITQPDGMAIDSLEISGGVARLPNLTDYLEEKLAVPVTILEEVPPESAIKWQESAGALTQYVIAIGLGLQGVRLGEVDVDFLPEERKIARDFPWRPAVVMAAILAGMIAIASQAGTNYTNLYRLEASRLQEEIQQQQGGFQEYEEAQNLHNEVAEKIEDLAKGFGQRDYWLDFLAKVASVKPPEMLIDGIEMNHDGAVRIIGLSETAKSAPDFVDALNKAFPEAAQKATIGAVNSNYGDPRYEVPVSRFEISLKVADKENHLRIAPETPVAPGSQ